eukprot:10210958-Prorocentrum_lima.AAC.1
MASTPASLTSVSSRVLFFKIVGKFIKRAGAPNPAAPVASAGGGSPPGRGGRAGGIGPSRELES